MICRDARFANVTLVACHFVVVLLQNKKKLITYVIASGLMYGEGENILRSVFNVRRI